MAALDLSFARLRFRGHERSLNTIWQAFHDRPRTALTAAELADITGLPFPEVHARLTQTPEMFLRLPPKPKTNTQYRLAMRVERLSPDAITAFIRSAERSETRILYAFVSAFVGLLALFVVVDVLS
jgi:hypothetical protein